jgi:hypothetical protein
MVAYVYVLMIYCTLGCGKTPAPPTAMVFDSQSACDDTLASLKEVRRLTIGPDQKFDFDMRCVPALSFQNTRM